MNSKLLFLLGCIPTRILLIYMTYISIKYPDYQKLLGLLLLTISFSFFYLFLYNKRLDAYEAGGYTWWARLRPVHGIFYLVAGIMCLRNNSKAYLILICDLVFGLGAFINYRFLDE
jgi:hypothetical protein